MFRGATIFAAGTVFGTVVGGVCGIAIGATVAASVLTASRTYTPSGVRFDYTKKGPV